MWVSWGLERQFTTHTVDLKPKLRFPLSSTKRSFLSLHLPEPQSSQEYNGCAYTSHRAEQCKWEHFINCESPITVRAWVQGLVRAHPGRSILNAARRAQQLLGPGLCQEAHPALTSRCLVLGAFPVPDGGWQEAPGCTWSPGHTGSASHGWWGSLWAEGAGSHSRPFSIQSHKSLPPAPPLASSLHRS